MKANEAKEIAEKKRKEPISRVLNSIKKAAEGGNMSVYVYENLYGETIQSLVSLGYTVRQLPSYPREPGIIYEISWS